MPKKSFESSVRKSLRSMKKTRENGAEYVSAARALSCGYLGHSTRSTRSSAQFETTTRSGSRTTRRRWAVAFSSSRRQCSSSEYGMRFSERVTPTRSTNLLSEPGVKPRRRSPKRVGILGSSQPSTKPSWTRRVSLRFETTTWPTLRREYSQTTGR
eukprot:Amastigsp_a509418_92.p3 type:complete len:156 gc:universal Amastigsp_a509418_92:446-913(+)